MRWRKPKEELPKEGQKIWVMSLPHKYRGSFLDSAMSIKIYCGETSYADDGSSCRVENGDELGQGNRAWYFYATQKHADYMYVDDWIMAWMPVEEMVAPTWLDIDTRMKKP